MVIHINVKTKVKEYLFSRTILLIKIKANQH